jgi:hypothetical protein
MTRLFTTVALLGALAAPAKAQLSPPPGGPSGPDWITPTQVAIIAATLAGYQINCDDLGPKDTPTWPPPRYGWIGHYWRRRRGTSRSRSSSKALRSGAVR